MSSRSQRQQMCVWLLARGVATAAEKSGVDPRVSEAVAAVRPYLLAPGDNDRASIRAIAKVLEFMDGAAQPAEDGAITPANEAAFFYAAAALVSDCYRECPETPPARKAAWLALNNALADLSERMFDGCDQDLGVAEGCRWAEAIDGILKRI